MGGVEDEDIAKLFWKNKKQKKNSKFSLISKGNKSVYKWQI